MVAAAAALLVAGCGGSAGKASGSGSATGSTSASATGSAARVDLPLGDGTALAARLLPVPAGSTYERLPGTTGDVWPDTHTYAVNSTSVDGLAVQESLFDGLDLRTVAGKAWRSATGATGVVLLEFADSDGAPSYLQNQQGDLAVAGLTTQLPFDGGFSYLIDPSLADGKTLIVTLTQVRNVLVQISIAGSNQSAATALQRAQDRVLGGA